jgi:hypothetical protein
MVAVMRSITAPISRIPFVRGVAMLALLGTCWFGGCFSPGADLTGSGSSGGTGMTGMTGTTDMVTTGATTVTATTTPGTGEATTGPGSASMATSMEATGSATSVTVGTDGTDGTASTSSSSTSDVSSTGPMNVCGDGIVAGDEECDEPLKTAGCTEACKFKPHLIVFVTSLAFPGDSLNGVVPDQHCNTLAAVQPALDGRKFVPWLSTSVLEAVKRIGVSSLPYRLPDKLRTFVAQDTTGLLSGGLLAPIDTSEDGLEVVPPLLVWTGTTPAGGIAEFNCMDWDPAGETGTVGSVSAIDGAWTSTGISPCGDLRRVYCVQIP